MAKMMELSISCSLFVIGMLLAIYGAGFSWRHVVVGSVALMFLLAGGHYWNLAYAPQPFTRFQFRFCITDMALALQEAGLYEGELSEATSLILKEMTGRGCIFFTWLEPELFYVNTTNQYSSDLDISINLPAYGGRVAKRTFELSDIVEMRMSDEGYEVVLLTREQQYANYSTRGIGVVLFKLPYKALGALQGELLEAHKKATEILTASGLTYESDSEVGSAWDFRNKYGSFRWWSV